MLPEVGGREALVSTSDKMPAPAALVQHVQGRQLQQGGRFYFEYHTRGPLVVRLAGVGSRFFVTTCGQQEQTENRTCGCPKRLPRPRPGQMTESDRYGSQSGPILRARFQSQVSHYSECPQERPGATLRRRCGPKTESVHLSYCLRARVANYVDTHNSGC